MKNEVTIKLIDVDPSGTRYCYEYMVANIIFYDHNEDELILNRVSIIGFIVTFERALNYLSKKPEAIISDIYQTVYMKLNAMGKFVNLRYKNRNYQFHIYFILKSLDYAKIKLYDELLEEVRFKNCLDQERVYRTLFFPENQNNDSYFLF